MSSESDSPDLQKSKTFFQYGNDAAMKGNLDYAIAMYRQASKLVPDNMIYRQALRGVERKKFNNDPKSVSKLVGMKNQPLLMQAKSARSKGKFNDALELCEDAFANNPWDVGAAGVAAEAAEGLGLGALSQWLIDSVQAIAKDADFFRFAGGIYETNESWAKAIACWEQVKKLNPNDQDVSRKINALSAASTIKRSGLDEALDQRAVQAKQDAAAPAAESMDAKLERLKQEQLTPEQRLVKEILTDPTALHAYVQLADIYRSRSDLEKAEKVLAKGLKANPNDAGLMSIYEDTQITRLKRAVQSQTHRAQENPDDTGAKVKLDELTEMLNKYQIQAYRRRTSLHPEDANLHLPVRRHPGADRQARRGDRRIPAGAIQLGALAQDPGSPSNRAELRGQQRTQAGRAQLQGGPEVARSRGQGELQGAPLPPRPGLRDPRQHRARRRALQRGCGDRLYLSRRRRAAPSLDLTGRFVVSSSIPICGSRGACHLPVNGSWPDRRKWNRRHRRGPVFINIIRLP